MPVIAILGAPFCSGEEVAGKTSALLGLEMATDQTLIGRAAGRAGLSDTKLAKILAGRASAFNKFTHERERGLAQLKLAAAEIIQAENLVLHGLGGLFLPRPIGHVMHVLVIADMAHRTRLASPQQIHKEDEAVAMLARETRQSDPWADELYDLVIPVNKLPVPEAVALILESAGKEVIQPTEASRQAAADCLLAARVEAKLAEDGHFVTAAAARGRITLTINKHTLMLARLEGDLKRLAAMVPGVGEVETKVGPGFHQADIYRQMELDAPGRVLLVDDEREFVQTLSERLLMRDVESAVVYDGEEALSFVKDDEPDVMVLDLKMPGIDGVEVLRRVKRDHPDIEVIILTGHGSKADEELCLGLGAFAYLQKPVDIELLSQKMREAYRKLCDRRNK